MDSPEHESMRSIRTGQLTWPDRHEEPDPNLWGHVMAVLRAYNIETGPSRVWALANQLAREGEGEAAWNSLVVGTAGLFVGVLRE